jgi:hypothetical protein
MALGKTATNVLNAVTVSATANSTASSGIDLSSAVDFALGYQMTFNAAATLGARIDLFGDPAGATLDFTIGTYADAVDSADITPDAGHQVQGVVQLNRSAKYVKARVYNLDSVSITACSLWAIPQTP